MERTPFGMLLAECERSERERRDEKRRRWESMAEFSAEVSAEVIRRGLRHQP